MSWSEVKQAAEENRYELVLFGSVISERISVSGLDPAIFQLTRLNFLQISNTSLNHVPDEIGNLINLRTLDMHRNAIKSIPSTIGKLKDVKAIDFSGNSLEKLPAEIGHMEHLQTLNLNCNALTTVPPLRNAKNLARLDISHNRLESLPEGIFNLELIAEIYAANNLIQALGNEVGCLHVLKVLDLSENKLEAIPCELADCLKLKDLNLKENPIKDNRLGKLIKQCKTKAVLDYIATLDKEKGKGKKGGKKARNKRASEGDKEAQDADSQLPLIQVIHSDRIKVTVQPSVLQVRPYIVCTLVKDLDLSVPAMFKKFIAVQSQLHESLCDSRVLATIATHSLETLSLPLTYDAGKSEEVEILPLGRQKPVKAKELVDNLKAEAIKQKQKTKRNPLKTGLYKYLNLVDGVEMFSYLRDDTGAVVSLPPVTNSEASKIKASKQDVLVELTSSKELAVCKQVMDSLILKMIEAGLKSCPSASEVQATKQPQLVLEQVRVVNDEGQLKVVYPSHVDLSSDSVKVIFPQ
ncbi:predicted protein [Nematostella vectensis]|uniref:Leucine-rich repeat-containing protein 47 n=1 Tax=Nematostella vectensis TaxID=45351 RepID=A7RY02_NEMVE|nr:leucine-rich repeat-containing protein 47 [Nematostella vectensis]EDO43554.1 predicted protein [Nematostella vectensis]|eukprot:XP_001635617.1 predicted protein [Nematostella vectensis]